MNPTTSAVASWYGRHWRWIVLAILFYATFLNYLDRQTLSVALQPVAEEFKLDLTQRGQLLATFIYIYAFCQLGLGPLVDRLASVRWFFAVMVLGWSAATLGVTWARTYEHLLVLRALLGVFEAVNFPLGILIIARIFPPAQHALASGIFASGSVVATLVAPKLVIWLSQHYGWRSSFVVAGALGLTWVVPWLLIFRTPERYASEWVARNATAAARHAAREPLYAGLGSMLVRPAFWAVVGIGVGTVPGLYFLSQWLPQYFAHEWKIEFSQVLGNRLVLVYLFQDAGLWLGGLAVALLARRGLAVRAARRRVMLAAYGLTIAGMLIPFTRSVDVVVVLMGLFAAGIGAWTANLWAFKSEIDPARVGTVTGFANCIETMFAALVVQLVGAFVQRTGHFTPVFWFFAGLLTLAAGCAWRGLRPTAIPLSPS